MGIQGRRIYSNINGVFTARIWFPCDYGRHQSFGWVAKLPNTEMVLLEEKLITEHEDGTITSRQAIKSASGGWEGSLVNGMWQQ